MYEVTQNNFYASSTIIGRKSEGSFFGLKYRNKSKHYKVRIHVVHWQTWFVELYNDNDGIKETAFYLHQVGEAAPSIEIRDSNAYKIGYRYCWENAEVSENLVFYTN